MNESSSKSINHRLIAILAGCITLVVVFATLDGPGLTWDEPFYIAASEVHIEWLLSPSFTRASIDEAWGPNREHPPLAKVFIGITRTLMRMLNPQVSPLFASRIASALLFAGLVALVYLWASRFGHAAGFSAALFALLMPRLLAHSRFAALDLPTAFIWFAVAFAFHRAINSRNWAIAAGVLFGAALLTKINAIFLPLPLIAWALIFHRKKALAPCLLLAIGPVLFTAGWPWLWPDPLSRMQDFFLGTTIDRFIVPVYYFGRIYSESYAPWHYPFVLTLLTVPAGTLICLVVGGWRSIGKTTDDDGRWLLIFNAVVVLAVASLPFSPKYDGVRLFLPLLPLIACLAGLGFQHLWDKAQKLQPFVNRPRLLLGAAGLFFTLQATSVILYHPYETSYYNILCGGLPGADRLGLETTYWHDTVSEPVFEHLRLMARQSRGGLRVAFYPVGHLAKAMYEIEGQIDGQTLIYADYRTEPFDVVVLVNRQGMLYSNEEARRLFDEGETVYEVRRMGVALTRVVKAQPQEEDSPVNRNQRMPQ